MVVLRVEALQAHALEECCIQSNDRPRASRHKEGISKLPLYHGVRGIRSSDLSAAVEAPPGPVDDGSVDN
jgi:hypothetical protein